MTRFDSRRWASRFVALPVALMLGWATVPAHAQDEPAEPASVESMIQALSGTAKGGVATRSWLPTAAPDVSTNLCAGPNEPKATVNGARNLEVVPYAGDGAASVDLDLRFSLASDALSKGDQAKLGALATAMRSDQLRGARFAIAGHTDASGSNGANLPLSCARAIAARSYLIGHGVAASRLTAYGFGSQRLAAPNDPMSGKNRRVEVRRADGQ